MLCMRAHLGDGRHDGSKVLRGLIEAGDGVQLTQQMLLVYGRNVHLLTGPQTASSVLRTVLCMHAWALNLHCHDIGILQQHMQPGAHGPFTPREDPPAAVA